MRIFFLSSEHVFDSGTSEIAARTHSPDLTLTMKAVCPVTLSTHCWMLRRGCCKVLGCCGKRRTRGPLISIAGFNEDQPKLWGYCRSRFFNDYGCRTRYLVNSEYRALEESYSCSKICSATAWPLNDYSVTTIRPTAALLSKTRQTPFEGDIPTSPQFTA